MIQVFTTMYNNGHLLPRCIESIQKQNELFKCHIIDDCSTDDSFEQSKLLIKKDDRFTITQNKSKLYQVGCYDYLIKEIDDQDIVVAVDSDDYLIDSDCFSLVLEQYYKGNVITHGSYLNFSGKPAGQLASYLDISQLRSLKGVPSHLRTWKAWLWKKMPNEALRCPAGHYWTCAGDLAFMYSMIELSNGRVGFIKKPIYCYDDTQLNCNHYLRPEIQKENERIIRSRTSLFPKIY